MPDENADHLGYIRTVENKWEIRTITIVSELRGLLKMLVNQAQTVCNCDCVV